MLAMIPTTGLEVAEGARGSVFLGGFKLEVQRR